ncbi:MAG: hypothetical protein ABI205_06920 [Gemmatimonadaceae bacterium]
MSVPDTPAHPYVATIEHLGRRYVVTCRVSFDGIEYVGRLWFAEEDWDDAGSPDRAAIPGRSREEVVNIANQLSTHELGLRHRRALAEKRRFLKLRRVTDDVLTKIRYINQISIATRDGLLDAEGAKQEIDLTEKQLHECIERLRHNAGVED